MPNLSWLTLPFRRFDHGLELSDLARSDRAIPRSDHAVARSDHAVSRFDRAVSRTDHAVARTDRVVSHSDHAVSHFDHVVSRSDRAVSRSDRKNAPADPMIAPLDLEITRLDGEHAPAYGAIRQARCPASKSKRQFVRRRVARTTHNSATSAAVVGSGTLAAAAGVEPNPWAACSGPRFPEGHLEGRRRSG